MNLEDTIRKIVDEQIAKHQSPELLPLEEFCRRKNLSRTTLWRAEREGKIKLVRIGRKVFVNSSQFFERK